MGVLCRRLDVFMPERILYQRDRRAVFKAMGCMSMSHPVRRYLPRCNACSIRCSSYNPVDHRLIHAPPVLLFPRSLLPGLKDVTVGGIKCGMQVYHFVPCGLIEQHKARFLALAKDRNLSTRRTLLQLRPGEIAQLFRAQARPIEQDQDCMVTWVILQCEHLGDLLLAHNPLSQSV